MKLGEPKTADFTIYYYVPPPPYEYEEHSMVLKSKDYWENTVQKIGFWGSENYFYERDKKTKNPSQKPNNNNQYQSENKKIWVKIAWICLPILLFFFALFLFIKLIGKKQK